MPSRVLRSVVLCISFAAMVGCGTSSNPASPSTGTLPPSIDSVVGDWTPVWTMQISVNGTEGGCSHRGYNILGRDASSALVTFDVACYGYEVKGTASAIWQNATLTWTGTGTAVTDTTNCPFAFNGSAIPYNSPTLQLGDLIDVFYNGTVCGTRFSGDEMLKRK